MIREIRHGKRQVRRRSLFPLCSKFSIVATYNGIPGTERDVETRRTDEQVDLNDLARGRFDTLRNNLRNSIRDHTDVVLREGFQVPVARCGSAATYAERRDEVFQQG